MHHEVAAEAIKNLQQARVLRDVLAQLEHEAIRRAKDAGLTLIEIARHLGRNVEEVQ